VRAWLLVVALFPLVACGERPPPAKFEEGSDAPNTACEASNACRVWGWCGQNGTECVAVSDEKCRASRACKVSGLCSFRNGQCIAKSSDDCDGSQYCKENGLCSASEGVCK
jgi:hypothetical protein